MVAFYEAPLDYFLFDPGSDSKPGHRLLAYALWEHLEDLSSIGPRLFAFVSFTVDGDGDMRGHAGSFMSGRKGRYSSEVKEFKHFNALAVSHYRQKGDVAHAEFCIKREKLKPEHIKSIRSLNLSELAEVARRIDDRVCNQDHFRAHLLAERPKRAALVLEHMEDIKRELRGDVVIPPPSLQQWRQGRAPR